MTAPTATRTELLRRRAQIAFAEQGRDLLRDKRTALMRELRRIDAGVLDALDEVARRGAQARAALVAAVAAEGEATVRAVALGATRTLRVHRHDRMLAGVRVVTILPQDVRRAPADRGAAPVLVPASVAAASEAYEEYLESVLAVAALEQTVRRLAEEIARSTRQVNALENVVIPERRRDAAMIRATLDEREREEHARLKRARDSRRPHAPGGRR